jgi:galactose mutarotase-like enzyme
MTYETVTITSPGGRTEARFVPAANMVCCSLSHDGIERLALRRGLEAYAQDGKTMGIPLLYPWANRLERFGYEAAGKAVALAEDDARIPRDSEGLPIHGVVPRLLQWTVPDQHPRDALEARLDWSSPDLLELFPYRHEVQLELRVADGELAIATTVRATGGDAVPVSFGYHPYLRIPDSPRETWDVELGATRRLVLDQRSIPTGEREPVIERRINLGHTSWDAAFDGLSVPPQFSAAAGQAEITVTFETGYGFAQLFAPAEQEFICFEPMTATSNALNSGDGLQILAPGGEHQAKFTIAIAAPGGTRTG